MHSSDAYFSRFSGVFRIRALMDEMMTKTTNNADSRSSPLRSKIASHSASLSAKLQEHQSNIFTPHARKTIRSFSPSEAAKLLKEFDARISQSEPNGKIMTWEKCSDGKHYTHKAKDWHSKAFFLPKIEANQLTFNIIKPKDINVSSLVYAYYHGHLLETFLHHFDTSFQNGIASALPEKGDNVSS